MAKCFHGSGRAGSFQLFLLLKGPWHQDNLVKSVVSDTAAANRRALQVLERAGEKSGSSFWTGFHLGGEKAIAQSRKLSCRPQAAHQTAGLASGDEEKEAAPRAPLHPSAWWAAPGAPTHGSSIPSSGPLRRCSRFTVFCSSLSGSALRLSWPHFLPLPSLPPTPSHHTVLSSHM